MRIRTVATMLALVSLGIVLGCSEEAPPAGGGGGDGQAAASVDRSDPEATLRGFVESIQAKDKDKMASFLHPDEKVQLLGELTTELMTGWPEVPSDLNLGVAGSGDVRDIDTNFEFIDKLRMKKMDGKWYVGD